MWTLKHDTDLMIAIYNHGLGNTEKYYSDKTLIFSTDNIKEI
jgi:hypothetical protein